MNLPHDEPPVFGAPWQAQAFAMTLQLHQRGLFSWPEWAAALSAQIAAAPPAAPGAGNGSSPAETAELYWCQWLAALEGLVAAKGAAQADELARCAQAWEHAAERTPHGQPIVLLAADFQA